MFILQALIFSVQFSVADPVCSVDRKKTALNHKGLRIYKLFQYVFYVPLNFGLGDFLLGMGVKEIEGYAKKYR